MAEDGDKSELPTEKRLREAFAEGQFARSPDIGVVFILVAALCVLMFTLREQTVRVLEISIGILGNLGKYVITKDGITDWAGVAVSTMLQLTLPMGITCALAAVLAGGLQSRFQFTPKALEPKFSRLDPMAGFQRIFSMQGWVKLGTDLIKLAVVGLVVWGAVETILSDPLFYTPVSLVRLANFMQESASTLLARFILSLGCVAAVTYIYQLRKVGQDLKMTKHEIKEENRQSEGDPLLKSALRMMARRLLQKQMLGAVPNADVVVTNPTHYAVALKYERGADKAPVVLAKGSQGFAKRIKALAAEHEVPMIENRPVARMLYKYGKVGKPVPVEMYKAVAEILAFVYKTHRYYFHTLKNRRAATAMAEKAKATNLANPED